MCPAKAPKIWAAVCATEVDDKYPKLIKDWVNFGGYVHKFLDGWKDWERTGFNTDFDKQKMANVLWHIVDKVVPRFGSSYAEVIRGVPKAMDFMAGQRQRMNDAIALGGS